MSEVPLLGLWVGVWGLMFWVWDSQFEYNYFTALCNGSEAGSYLRLVDFVYHSILGLRVRKKKSGKSATEVLGLRVRKKKKKKSGKSAPEGGQRVQG